MRAPILARWTKPVIAHGVIAMLLLSACGALPQITTSVDYCCKVPLPALSTFRVEFEGMPEFLKPMLRDEAAIVLHTKGLEYTEGDAHAVLKMTYVHNVLPAEAPAMPLDGPWQRPGSGGAIHFMAEVDFELRESVSRELVWSGTMVRAHHVQMGAYMHDVPARSAMRQAFTALFADYPDADR